MEEMNVMIQEYAKNPVNNFSMDDFTVKRHEGNFICWDDITVYLFIEDNIVKNYSFDWNASTITIAAASLLSEIIIWASLLDILTWNYDKMVSLWFSVSPRRKRAAVIALLASRNAIHDYLGDEKEDSFDDVIDD